MKKIFIISALVFFWFLFTSCKTTQKPIVDTKKIETIIHERLVLIYDTIPIPGAIATGEVLFYCDSLNRVQMSALNISESERLRLQVLYNAALQKLNIQAKHPPDTVFVEKYIQVADTTRLSEVELNIPFEVIKEKNVYPTWLVVLAVLGGVFIGFGIFKFISFIRKIKVLPSS